MINAFQGANALRQLTLGKQFHFGADASLRVVLNNTTYTGNWINLDTEQPPLTSAQLMTNAGNPMAGTWVWQLRSRMPATVSFNLFENDPNPQRVETLTGTTMLHAIRALDAPFVLHHALLGWAETAGGPALTDGEWLSKRVVGDTTIYAVWQQISPVATWTELQAAINFAPPNVPVTIRISDSFHAPTGTPGNAITIPANRRIILESTVTGAANVRVLTQANNAQRHFIVHGSLTLCQNITLCGGGTNSGGVEVRGGGTFTMNAGSVIENCLRTVAGGAVALIGSETAESTRATFNLVGGTIRNNRANHNGGGVHLGTNAEMTMSAGSITGNASTSPLANTGGGGVFLGTATSTFTMTGGTISGNTTNDQVSSIGGGGVRVQDGTFTLRGGTIGSAVAGGGNSGAAGGGVRLQSGTMNMTGGTISGNTSTSTAANTGGGGVLITGGIFTMSGGAISNNQSNNGGVSANTGGGGVRVNGGTFRMTGWPSISNNRANGTSPSAGGGGIYQASGIVRIYSGSITNNHATNQGGGVRVAASAADAFTMTGGRITNNHAGTYGGGIFTTQANPSNPVPITAYRNLNISDSAEFSGNTAGRGSSAPPDNDLPHIQAASSSIFHCVLNNYDINYTGRLGQSILTVSVRSSSYSAFLFSDIYVEISSQGGGRTSGVTDSSGVFTAFVPPGTHTVRANLPHSLQKHSGGGTVYVPSGGTVDATVLVYKTWPTFFAGGVQDWNGNPIEGSTINISAYCWNYGRRVIYGNYPVNYSCCGCFWFESMDKRFWNDLFVVDVYVHGIHAAELFTDINFGRWNSWHIPVWVWWSAGARSSADMQRFNATEQGILSGTIQCASDMPIANADVRLICAATGDMVGQVTTDAYGRYSFYDVVYGVYSIVVAADDFFGGSFGFVIVEDSDGAVLDAVMMPRVGDDVDIANTLRREFGAR